MTDATASKFSVETLSCTESEEWEDGETDYCGREIIVLTRNGKRVAEYWEPDPECPEDSRFCRSLSWVASAIQRAYQFGLEDGGDRAVPAEGPQGN